MSFMGELPSATGGESLSLARRPVANRARPSPSPTTHTDSGGREPTAERGNSRSECATVSVWRDVWRTASRSDRSGGSFCIALEEVDRKSVVEGKSVSVHVDLGGRSIIKKKKTTV